jgi:kinetochore protein NDC80
MNDDMGGEENGEKLFYDYLTKAYVAFMAGRDDLSDLEQDLVGTFEAKNEALRAEMTRTEAQNAEMRAEIEALRTTKTPLETLRDTTRDLSGDIDKFRKLIANLQTHKQQLIKKLAERTSEAEAKKRELEGATLERDQLQRIFDAQDLSAADVERMNKDRNMLEETLSQAVAQKETAQAAVWQLEVEISKKFEELDRIVHTFNGKAAIMQLIPATAKYAKGRSLELAVNYHAANSTDVLSTDIRTVVKPAVEELEAIFAKKISATTQGVAEARDKAERTRELVAERKESLAVWEQKLAKVEATLAAEKEAYEERLKRTNEDTTATEKEIVETKEASNRSVAEAQQEIARLQSKTIDIDHQHK